jgi:hypothetical protein
MIVTSTHPLQVYIASEGVCACACFQQQQQQQPHSVTLPVEFTRRFWRV